jgi:hypothetical protein
MAYRRIPENEARCYVYVITVDGVLRYIGKGTGRRIDVHLWEAKRVNARREAGEKVRARKLYNRLAKALRLGADIQVAKIAEGLTHLESIERERAEIAAIPDGVLWNSTAGGEGMDTTTAKALWRDPEIRAARLAHQRSGGYRDRARQKTIAQFSDPEARRRSSENSRKLWEDPDFRQRVTEKSRANWSDPEVREKHRAAVKRGWEENPERRVERSRISKEAARRPGSKEKRSESSKRRWEDPEFKKRATAHWNDPVRKAEIVASWTPEFLERRGKAISEGLRKSKKAAAAWASPERSAISKETARRVWTPEARAARSAKMKELWADPAFREKTTAHWYEKRKKRSG